MLPFFAYPLALAALAALPILAAIYLFRHRFRRRTVSSLLLWRFRVQTSEGGAKVQRLQLPLLFFLELLALLLLAVAASGPQWKQPHAGRPLIVVLDDSFSMRAVHEGDSARDRAHQFLERLLRQQPPLSTRLVLAGPQPRVAGPPVHTWTELNELLNGWTCQAPFASMDDAITLASELGGETANVLVLTDHPPADPRMTGDRLEWQAYGQPAPNLALVNASRAAHADQDRCLLEIANYSTTPRSARLDVRTGSNTLQTATLELAPQERQRLVFNVPSGTPLLDATLEPDALVEDNAIQLLPPVRRRVRVRVALTNSATAELVERALEVTGLRAAISADPELTMHHSETAPAGTNTWGVRWVISSGTDAAAFTGPFVVDGTHPLAEGLGLQGVIWTASTNLSIPQGSVPVILAGNTPLVLAREDALGRRQITLNLNPELSTLHHTPDWPILFWNLLQWRASEQPGLLENNARLGAEVQLLTAGQPVEVTWPDGTTKSFPQTADRLALETPLPGLYSVVMGNSTNAFAVNPLAAEESELADCVTGRWGAWKNEADQRLQLASAAWILGLAALTAMTMHLFLLARGRSGST